MIPSIVGLGFILTLIFGTLLFAIPGAKYKTMESLGGFVMTASLIGITIYLTSLFF